MVRPLSFDRNAVIEKSMQVFWLNGFQGTTMRDIGKAVELNPGSVYGSFGSKRKLFFLVLEHYYKGLTVDINQSLHNATSNNTILENFFKLILIQNENTQVKGCLLVNCLLEMANDREIQSNIAAMFTGLEEMFYWIIVKGQKDGEYKPGLDPRITAKFLINNYFGLRVQCMTEKDNKQLEQIINNFLSILE